MRNHWWGKFFAIAFMTLCLPAAHAAEEPREIEFDLEALSLQEAIERFEQITGEQVEVNPRLLPGRRSAAVEGSRTPAEALRALVAGSDLEVIELPSGGFRIADGDVERLQAVEVTGRYEEQPFAEYTFAGTKTQTHLLDLAQSISTVTKEVIQDRALMRLNDIAPYVAGVNEFSVYNDITIRGFRNSDDRRVNGLRTYNNFWSQDIIAHVERVEVIKGPAAVMFGDASPGGVINIVTKKPLAREQQTLSARFGTYDGYSGNLDRYIAFDTTGPVTDGFLYRLNLAYEDSDSFRTGIFNENLVAAPSFTFLPADGTRINLDFVYTDANGILDRGQPTIDGVQNLESVPIHVSLTQVGDALDYETLSTTLSLDQRINDDWSFVVAYMNHDYEEDLREHRIRRYVSPTEISMVYNDRQSEADVNSLSSYLVGKFETGSVKHELVAGVDLVDREDVSSQVNANDVAIFDLTNPQNIVRDVASYNLVTPSWSPWGGTLETRGVYVQDRMTLGAWDFMLGLRHDEFDVSYVENADTGPNSYVASDSQVSPRLSALYRINGDQSVYASWITGFQPPDTWNNNPAYGGPFDPRESSLFEIGYKQMLFHGQALFVASLYRLTLENEVVWANDPNNPDLYIQRGEERATGLELELSGEVADNLRVIANYAYNDAEIVDDPDPSLEGAPKENAPKHKATVWARYDLNGDWGIGAGAEYVDERHTFEPTLQLPAYTLFNAAVYYEPSEDLELALQVKNLTDKTHWTGGYYYGRVYPGEPRSVSVTANYRF